MNILLEIIKELPKFGGKLENITVAEDSECTFSIKIAGGVPRPQFVWYFEEEEITITDESYEITEVENTITLTIKNVKSFNSGTYYVKLINEAGKISSNKAQLIVNSTLFFLIKLISNKKTNKDY